MNEDKLVTRHYPSTIGQIIERIIINDGDIVNDQRKSHRRTTINLFGDIHLLYIRICGESGKALIKVFQNLFSLHRFPELFSFDFSNLVRNRGFLNFSYCVREFLDVVIIYRPRDSETYVK